MKLLPIWMAGLIATAQVASHALIVEGADGSDGVFAPSEDVLIDLTQASEGSWNSVPNVPGKGVYDPGKWAVVFKFRSVSIPANVTVRFANHPSRAPVIWLVEQDVVIAGRIELDARDVSGGAIPAEPGPGGFRGGWAGVTDLLEPSPGFGPGGGRRGVSGAALGASYLLQPDPTASPTYGDERITHLIGGSGGGGSVAATRHPGGAGGGAILIAAQGNIAINRADAITALPSSFAGNRGASGSGGTIRLVAEQIIGNDGTLRADGSGSGASGGSPGRISVEAKEFSGTLFWAPSSPRVDLAGNVARIWDDLAPEARIISVADVPAPQDPRARLGLSPADIRAGSPGMKTVTIETRNFPIEGTVKLIAITPAGPRQFITATHLSGDYAQATWRADVEFLRGNTLLQVHATSNP